MNITKSFKNEIVKLLAERVGERVTQLNHGLVLELVQPVLLARLEEEAIAAVDAAIGNVAGSVTGKTVFNIYRDLTMKKKAAAVQVTAPKPVEKVSGISGGQGVTPRV